MEDQEAIEVLKGLLAKETLSPREREAVRAAVGILSWSKLGQARIKKIGRMRRVEKEQSIKIG